MNPYKQRHQLGHRMLGQSMTEYLVVTVFCLLGVFAVLVGSKTDGGDKQFGGTYPDPDKVLPNEYYIDGFNSHERQFKNQMMVP